MAKHIHFVNFLFLCCALASCAPASDPSVGGGGGSGADGDVPDTEDARVLNALGQLLGQNIADVGFSAEELAFVQRGLSDAVLGQEPLVELSEYGPRVQELMQERAARASEAELELATAFIEEQANIDGVERTESGIVIQELTAGTGAQPTAEDTVQVHYHGTLRDGTVFDSSVERGEPATFPLTGVIPCWTEGLQQINVGGKSRLVCPPDLAYGAQGPPGIPGNSALVFEVELLDIIQN